MKLADVYRADRFLPPPRGGTPHLLSEMASACPRELTGAFLTPECRAPAEYLRMLRATHASLPEAARWCGIREWAVAPLL